MTAAKRRKRASGRLPRRSGGAGETSRATHDWPPTPLSSSQRSRLRSLGQPFRPSVAIGRAGLTPTVVSQVRQELRAHLLIKVRLVAAGVGRSSKDQARELAQRVDAELVGLVGRALLLYRSPSWLSPDEPPSGPEVGPAGIECDVPPPSDEWLV